MNLLKISDPDFWEQIHARHNIKGGVYKIIAVKDGQRVPINRFLGIDKEGILYIGKATSYINRVISLKTSISPEYRGKGHICGRRYKSNEKIAEYFSYDNLFIDLIQSETPEADEDTLLKTYFKEFGEAPPLNAQY
ncbi:MAG: hypothetical protein ACT4ON_13555 [Bacteroidota bacterium]